MITISELLAKLKGNALDYYVTSLLMIGLPLIVWSYTGFREALLTHIGIVTLYGVLKAYQSARGTE